MIDKTDWPDKLANLLYHSNMEKKAQRSPQEQLLDWFKNTVDEIFEYINPDFPELDRTVIEARFIEAFMKYVEIYSALWSNVVADIVRPEEAEAKEEVLPPGEDEWRTSRTKRAALRGAELQQALRDLGDVQVLAMYPDLEGGHDSIEVVNRQGEFYHIGFPYCCRGEVTGVGGTTSFEGVQIASNEYGFVNKIPLEGKIEQVWRELKESGDAIALVGDFTDQEWRTSKKDKKKKKTKYEPFKEGEDYDSKQAQRVQQSRTIRIQLPTVEVMGELKEKIRRDVAAALPFWIDYELTREEGFYLVKLQKIYPATYDQIIEDIRMLLGVDFQVQGDAIYKAGTEDVGEFQLLSELPEGYRGGGVLSYIQIAPKELLAKLGQPQGPSPDDKVSGRYYFKHMPSGNIVALYDYKATNLYAPDLPSVQQFWHSDKPYSFHIGGRSRETANKFREWLRTTGFTIPGGEEWRTSKIHLSQLEENEEGEPDQAVIKGLEERATQNFQQWTQQWGQREDPMLYLRGEKLRQVFRGLGNVEIWDISAKLGGADTIQVRTGEEGVYTDSDQFYIVKLPHELPGGTLGARPGEWTDLSLVYVAAEDEGYVFPSLPIVGEEEWRTSNKKEGKHKFKVPKEVWQGIKTVRETGTTNMFDVRRVRQLLRSYGYNEADEWVKKYPNRYVRIIMEGRSAFEIVKSSLPGGSEWRTSKVK